MTLGFMMMGLVHPAVNDLGEQISHAIGIIIVWGSFRDGTSRRGWVQPQMVVVDHHCQIGLQVQCAHRSQSQKGLARLHNEWWKVGAQPENPYNWGTVRLRVGLSLYSLNQLLHEAKTTN